MFEKFKREEENPEKIWMNVKWKHMIWEWKLMYLEINNMFQLETSEDLKKVLMFSNHSFAHIGPIPSSTKIPLSHNSVNFFLIPFFIMMLAHCQGCKFVWNSIQYYSSQRPQLYQCDSIAAIPLETHSSYSHLSQYKNTHQSLFLLLL